MVEVFEPRDRLRKWPRGSEEMELANYLASQYRLYLEKQPYANWREDYEEICAIIANLANGIQSNDKDAFDSACHAIGEDPTSCLRTILYSRVNGVASVGQGGISARHSMP
jgi:hypothetical protein